MLLRLPPRRGSVRQQRRQPKRLRRRRMEQKNLIPYQWRLEEMMSPFIAKTTRLSILRTMLQMNQQLQQVT